MLGLAAAREGLDDEHACAAAGARTRQHARLVGRRGLGCVGRFGTDRDGEQFARPGDVGGADAAGQQAVVTDAVTAFLASGKPRSAPERAATRAMKSL